MVASRPAGLVLALAACGRVAFEPGEPADAPTDVAIDALASGIAVIPAGAFRMGSPVGEPCRQASGLETEHPVTLTHSFEMFISEVTQGEYRAATGSNPSNNTTCGSECPVESVTWHEAAAYCNNLSAVEARCYACENNVCKAMPVYSQGAIYTCPGFRLPTEAEWEYAYRAGTTTAYYSGANGPGSCATDEPNLNLIAWNFANSGGLYHPRGTRQPNAWGLVDMSGNVYEWCADFYHDELGSADAVDPFGMDEGTVMGRVIRGGAWYSNPAYHRAASRGSTPPDQSNPGLGFRCARTL